MWIILFFVLNFSISNIIIYGSIFEGFRNMLKRFGEGDYSLYKLFTCFMCLPTWVGFGLSLFLNLQGYYWLSPFAYSGVEELYYVVILDGLISSGVVYFINVIVEKLEK
jgi:hypothetical protein